MPRSLRKGVLEELHSAKTAGHMGVKKTLMKVRSRLYWSGVVSDVQSFIRQCSGCAQRKGPQQKRRAPMKHLAVGAPLERVALDVLGPLPQRESGNRFILVVGDYFSKWMEVYPIRDQSAETVADQLFEQFVCRYGVPLELQTRAETLKQLCSRSSAGSLVSRKPERQLITQNQMGSWSSSIER